MGVPGSGRNKTQREGWEGVGEGVSGPDTKR